MSERLQTFLARAGVASRRGADDVISSGRVRVNGTVVYEKGSRIDAEKDRITFDGKDLCPVEKLYYVVNKPTGYASTVRDPHESMTVVDLVSSLSRLYPVGRLDKDTAGLLVLTNDGDLTLRLTHPRYGIRKVYQALVKGRVGQDGITKLEKGIALDGVMTAPCKGRIIRRNDRETVVELEIGEGKKRQVRRMLQAIGHPVAALERIAFAGLTLKELRLKRGECRRLTDKEVGILRRAAKDSLTSSFVVRGS